MLLAATPSAMALGFGAVHNPTKLGQSLDFSVAVRLDEGETLEPECVSAEVSNGDQRLLASDVHTRVVKGSSDREVRIAVVTTTRMREPAITVRIFAGCALRVERRFVSLLDPAPLHTRTEVPVDVVVSPPAAAPTGSQVAANAATRTAAEPTASASQLMAVMASEAAARKQLAAHEARVEQLQRELQASQRTLDEVRAQLREAQERPAIVLGLVGSVAGLIVLLGLAALVLWRRARFRNERAWRRNSEALSGRSSRLGDSESASLGVPIVGETTVTSMRVMPDASGYGALAWTETPPPAHEVNPLATLPLSARLRRELTAGELIDLEQQADFFLALGQEDAAIDLLMGHVRHSGGTSPVPYLKLLQIYRRRCDGEAYERIRERFNRRFNAHAPQWHSDPGQGRALDSYPDVVQRLQSSWKVPAQVTELLQALLFRRDASTEQFDLPAYEELLFLYAVARELAEQQTRRDGVDLLLPIEVGEAPPAIVRAEVSQMPVGKPPVDVDVDLGVPGPASQAS
jgi:hypothetical protein